MTPTDGKPRHNGLGRERESAVWDRQGTYGAIWGMS